MSAKLPFYPPKGLRVSSLQVAVAVSITLLCWPIVSDALSLGRSRGAAVLGRGLDVSVLASIEPQEEVPESSCFSAEVFYGDTRINVSSVTVTPLRTSPTELTLRVRSNTPIDEPFITLYVRAACGQSVTRRYVLLSDSPSEPAPAVQIPALPLLGAPTPLRAPAVITEPRGDNAAQIQEPKSRAADRAAARQESLSQKPQSRTMDPVATEKAQARRLARQQAKEQAKLQAKEAALERTDKTPPTPRSAMSPSLGSASKANTSRLKVDLLDLVPGREPSLRASAELLSQPTTDMATRAQAAAMWRMINASPQEMLRDVERLKTLETEVRAMSELTKRQTQELGVVKTELAAAQRDRYANPFMYALAALCLVALAFAAWMWRQRRSSHAPWWGNQQSLSKTDVSQSKSKPIARFGGQNAASVAAQEREREQEFVSASQLITPASAPMPLGDRAGPPPSFISSRRSAVDFDVHSGHPTSELVSPAPHRLGASSAERGAERDFESSAMGALRPVKAEELFDIQQQADFFMSLGQHAQAIDILQNHIGENVETSALAYLDLFDIYHKIDQRSEFADLRDEFNRVFNAQVPEFDQYGINSRGLEDYVPALERIQALWPNAKVLEVIEESIFRKPDFENQPFDLLAYRELMLLYAIAKDVSEYEDVAYDIEDNPDVDFDISQPGELLDDTMPGITSRAEAKGPANAGFPGTAVQPLSASLANPFEHNVPGNEVSIDDEWEKALKNVPLLSTSIGVDVDIGEFADTPRPSDAAVTPTSPPAVVASLDVMSNAPAQSKTDNGIDFDIELDAIQSSSKKPKR
jgi:tetratricopeptide (TPR) repeat protein